MDLIIKSLEDLPNIVKQIMEYSGNRRTFALYGEIGAGKTTFVNAFCKALGVEEETSSPTFSIINEYLGQDENVYHIDLYRLKDTDEAIHIGIEDYLEDDTKYCFIEWPEIIEPLFPPNTIKLRFEHVDDNSRKIILIN